MDNNKLKEILPLMIDSILQSRDEKHLESAILIKDKIDIQDPDKFYFNHVYDQNINNEFALKLKLTEKDPFSKISPYGLLIYFDFQDVENFISSIIVEHEGNACSVDKARYIVRTIMFNNFYDKPKKGKIGATLYSTPAYRKTKDWEDIILNYVNLSSTRNLKKLYDACNKVAGEYDKLKLRQKLFYNVLFQEIQQNEELMNSKCLSVKGDKISINNFFDNMLPQQVEMKKNELTFQQNAYAYLKKANPELMKEIRNKVKKILIKQ